MRITYRHTIRSREISASIILQSQSQLKAIYKDAAEIISDNCDCTLFLSGRGKNAKEIADVLGKETIDSYNQSENRGAQTSHGLNYQKLGKELMSQDEIATMDGGKCILQVRGVRPFFSEKYDITKHPRYKYLSDADKKNYFDVDRYLTALRRKRQRVVSQEETFDLYDIDLSDEDMATVDEWLAAFPINKSYQTEIMEVNLWHFSIAQLLLCRPSLWASAVPCVFGAASTFWKVTGRITRPAMLMCHKVTHKNLIDNHLLFRTKEPLMTV